jgi:hypothetical protein
MNSGARAQRLLLVVGSLLMVVFAAGYVYKAVMSRAALRRFQDFRAERLVRQNESSLDASGLKVDFSMWSEKRVAAYERSLAQYVDPPLAVLHISKVHLEVPVLEGSHSAAHAHGQNAATAAGSACGRTDSRCNGKACTCSRCRACGTSQD